MSRTYKDRPSKIRFPQDDNWVITEGCGIRKLPTIEPKKPKELNTEWRWIHGTPSWWNNLFHTRPIRGKFRNYTKCVVRCPIDYIENLFEPSDSNKPHKYFW